MEDYWLGELGKPYGFPRTGSGESNDHFTMHALRDIIHILIIYADTVVVSVYREKLKNYNFLFKIFQ